MMGRIERCLRRIPGAGKWAARVRELAISIRLKFVRVENRSPYRNIYYCCTQKTASQWLRSVFGDPAVFKYTGLKVDPYVRLGLKYAEFRRPFPLDTIATHLYIGYPVYRTIPKPDAYKTFFILRDPRDIVVSWYYSARYSHAPIPPVPEMRMDLRKLDREEGFRYIIDRLVEWGSFDAQRSWMTAADRDDKIRIFRFEDLAGDSGSFLQDLFAYLAIDMPEEEFIALCRRHAFRKYSGRRDQGMEDHHSHYRKGIAGDWQTSFSRDLTIFFEEKTGDLLDVLGYR